MRMCRAVVDSYIHWLSKEFEVAEGDNDCYIITPFLSPNADHIGIRAFIENGLLYLGDDGYALSYLFTSGVDAKVNPKRAEIIKRICRSNNVIEKDSELVISAPNIKDAPKALNCLLRAIDQVAHLVYTARESPARSFREDVVEWLINSQISFGTNHEVAGKVARHSFDLHFPRPKRLIVGNIMSAKSPYAAKRKAAQAAFSFFDLREAGKSFTGFAVIDDRKNVWESEAKSILNGYSDAVITWSRKERLLELVG